MKVSVPREIKGALAPRHRDVAQSPAIGQVSAHQSPTNMSWASSAGMECLEANRVCLHEKNLLDDRPTATRQVLIPRFPKNTYQPPSAGTQRFEAILKDANW